jgi:hypothetical protein
MYVYMCVCYVRIYVSTYVCIHVATRETLKGTSKDSILEMFTEKRQSSKFTGPSYENRRNNSSIGVASQSLKRSNKLYNC